MRHSFPHRLLRPPVAAFVAFLLAAVAAASVIWRMEQYRLQEWRASASDAASDHADALQRNIERALSATYALAALVRQGNGTVSNFDAVGREMLPFYPGVSSLSLAPGGIVGSVVPLAGNEASIGHDMLNDPARAKESVLARNTGKLTLAGPFDLVQGGMGAVGRLPVFLDDAKGQPTFWGFTTVLIRFPEVLETARLAELAEQRFAYELSRMHPDSGTKQIIAASSSAALIEPVVQTLQVSNAAWTLSVMPVKGWGDPLGLSLKAALGLLFSLLLGYVAKLLLESKAHAQGLEALVAQRTAEVQAREADLNRAQSVARVGSWVLDFATNEVRGSAEALRIVGMSGGGPFDFEAYLECVHPDDRNAVNRAWHAMRKGEPYDIEYRIMIGATIRWVHSYAELTFEADGTRRRALGTVQDITERKRVEQALHESENRFRSLTEMSSDFYWESDAEHRLTLLGSGGKANGVPAFRQPAQVGQRRWEIPYLSPDEAGWQAHRAVLDAHRPFRDFEFSRLGVDGSERHISVSGDPVFDGAGQFNGYRGVGTDITARKRSEEALRASVEQMRVFTDNVPTMTVAYDENLYCRFVNSRYANFFGLSATEMVGKHLREIVGEDTYREIEGYFAQVRPGHPVTYHRTQTLQSGEACYIEVNVMPHVGERGQALGSFVVITDITEHTLAEERIQHVAHHDSLTGLPNRLLFNDRLNHAISLAKRASRQFALFFLDLDRFKPVNDTLGHTAGDELLQGVAARIRQQVRESDTVARVGGDEFTVILPDIGRREDAETVARKIIAALATPFQLGSPKQSVGIGTSIGIALYPADAQDADALVKAADAAMYCAKQTGSNFRFSGT